MKVMEQHMELLEKRHFDHMVRYGRGNRRRLMGEESTADINEFSWGVGDRNSSIRIGARVAARGYGYYEDRRPASNMDPYEVTRLLVETTLLGAPVIRRMLPSKTTEISLDNVQDGLAQAKVQNAGAPLGGKDEDATLPGQVW